MPASTIQLPFIKMHGCGNDYVYLDCFENAVPADPGRLAVKVSDRHRSIGSDGLVLMMPPEAGGAARMRMFNADGSEGSLCGNALRCMGMWLHQTGRCGSEFQVEMGPRRIDVQIVNSREDIHSAEVRVIVGQPAELNEDSDRAGKYVRQVDLPDVPLPKLRSAVLHVSVGNPHTVLFVESMATVDFYRLGPMLEQHPAFPQRTNVEFVEVKDPTSARVRVWERGSGETLACGSGACAVVVAGCAAGYFDRRQRVRISMDGGDLSIFWDEGNNLHLQGAAEEACRGTILCEI